MPPLYTCGGDDGSTSAIGGKRVSKSNPRISALGDLDELNSVLGLARSLLTAGIPSQLVTKLQEQIIAFSAEVATEGDEAPIAPRIAQDDISRLEMAIKEIEEPLAPIKTFVLPGPPPAAAALHVARAVCRRAERSLVALHLEKPLRPELLAYINRLSDLLFALARDAAEAR